MGTTNYNTSTAYDTTLEYDGVFTDSTVLPPSKFGGGKGKGKGQAERKFVSESIGILRMVITVPTFVAHGVITSPDGIELPTIAASPELLREVIANAPVIEKSADAFAQEIIDSLMNEPEPADPNALSAFISTIPVAALPEIPLYPNDQLMNLPRMPVIDHAHIAKMKRRKDEETILLTILQAYEER